LAWHGLRALKTLRGQLLCATIEKRFGKPGIGVKTESGAEYFKSWRELPAFEYNEVENVYRFMRHIERLERKRVLPIPGPKH
jgi:hypothetical protein